ncbi:formate dehydrogenase subunit alpha [Halomarina pelagica]|uniref:formate dehydrogenase subunit alpha n=1 Tax=Halomarina pelagica TaxID=2961599 RepID=UPI0020C38C4C|nr:formate dehydrogenase subunit alpha [Halomarina sp. BND7]
MSAEPVSLDLDRRSFLKASALTGALALGGGAAGRALAQDGEDGVDASDDDSELVKTICNFCAVGCGFKAERKGNAFVGQEPWFENPINNGSLCSKGASIYGSEHSEKRLKHPLRLEGGEWKKISWDEAWKQIGDEFGRIREEYGPDSVMWLGSAHHCNEEAYAFRKLAAFWGTTNVDHQARICHSTTVSGLANTWGYGAMTNPINDYRHFGLNLIIGQNPAEAHPIAMQHILEGQRRGGTVVSVDARYTKTSAHADHFFRIRPGTDVALMMGLLRYLRDRGELDRTMLTERVVGWPDVEAELEKYDLETVADITWIDEADIRTIGDLMIENKPNVQIEWAMGGTQHNNGTQNIRSYALTGLATGGIARAGGGMQVMRGHSNVQGATDLGPNSHILPGYYSVTSPGSWMYWADVWNESPWTSGSTSFGELFDRYDLMPKGKWRDQDGEASATFENGGREFSSRSMMLQKGLTVARWFEGALPREERLNETPLYQPNRVKAAVFHGHSANSISEMDKQKKAMENLDLLVIVDMFPSLASVMANRDDGVVLLPCSSQYEHHGTLTNSHRAVQWRNPVRPPSHSAKPDMQIIQEFAATLGFPEHFDWGSGPGLFNGKTTYEDCLREINLGVRTIGYQQSPERLQQHYEYDYAFSTETTRAAKPGLPVSGDYWCLPWPCWGEGHPGTPIIWRDDLDPREGGQDFRARWGTKAPTPDEWRQMVQSGNVPDQRTYPFKHTVEQGGEAALDMLRAPYEPDWDTDFSGTVRGVPEYPGWTTTWPQDITNPDALSIPYEYALRPDKSIYDAAKRLKELGDAGQLRPKGAASDIDPSKYEQYDFKQPDPPTGRGRARGVAWNFLDTVPIHREPIESPRPDLVEKWPANGLQTNFYRLNQNNAAIQKRATTAAQKQGMDLVMTTGRQVEHQGGGSESRSNVFLADLQPHMYAEIHPKRAEELGVDGGEFVVVSTTDRGSVLVKARVTHRPRQDEVFLPFHWGGVYHGKSLEDRYPEGTVPYAIGDSVNIITSRGYDAETQMQETKAALVKVRKATPALLKELNMDVDLTLPQDRDRIGIQKEYDVRDHKTIQ